MTTLIEKNITAANTFSDSFRFDGDFNFSIRGIFDDATWTDVDTFTSISENVGYEPELLFYRAGCKTGEFTGGNNITVRFGSKWVSLT